MKKLHFIGTNFNTRGRITMQGKWTRSWRWIPFLSRRGVLNSAFCLPDGSHLLERLIAPSDKSPWPVRQKEAMQITLPKWQFLPSQWTLVATTWNLGQHLGILPALSALVQYGGDMTSKSSCVQPNLDKRSFVSGALVPELGCTLESAGMSYKFQT